MRRWTTSIVTAGFAPALAFATLPAFAGGPACHSDPGDAAAIHALIEDGRIGHETEDPVLTAAAYADVATSINRGKITRVTRQDVENRFRSYYTTVDILESTWLAEPQVTLLEGGCNAWSTATMLVRYAFSNSQGERRTARYEFAWTALWEKDSNGDWRRIMMASTDDGGSLE